MSEESVRIDLSYRQITAEMDQCGSSGEVLEILREEIAGPNRPAFVNRIYGRYDTLRRAEERVDLARAAVGQVAGWLQVPAQLAPLARAAGKAPGKGAATPVQGAGKAPASGAAKRTGKAR